MSSIVWVSVVAIWVLIGAAVVSWRSWQIAWSRLAVAPVRSGKRKLAPRRFPSA